MKTTNKIIKVISVLLMSYSFLGCSLDSSDGGTLVANQLRGSSSGGVTPGGSGRLGLDLNTGRPNTNSPKWGFLTKNKSSLEGFLSVIEGRNVTISQANFDSQYTQTYFWGDVRSKATNASPLTNPDLYFQSLDLDNFKFEITIWDYFTDSVDPTTNKRYDYLGYTFFGKGGSVQAGQLLGVYPGLNGARRLYFQDSLGTVVFAFVMNQSTGMMHGEIGFSMGTQSTVYVLGSFSNLRICEFFKCP